MVFIESHNIFSPLGGTSRENFRQMEAGRSAVKSVVNTAYDTPYSAALLDDEVITAAAAHYCKTPESFTRLEQMIIASISEALQHSQIDITSPDTLLVLSTTKGNIDLLQKEKSSRFEPERVLLWKTGAVIGNHFKNPNPVMVISNACISGVLALDTATMLINAGMYRQAVVCGADMVTPFVVSGFMSFKSVSPDGCKPFDAARNGLSPGEAASTAILTDKARGSSAIAVTGGGSANDANHISGPSRTGEGAYIAIKKALAEAGKTADDIDHISAHGTATPYNDEMESIAISRHRLQKAPVNSIKGYLGHTFGAAGIAETVILSEEMRTNRLLPTFGFEQHGVSAPVHIIKNLTEKEQSCTLKMASGFGGTNAALILEKVVNR